MSGRPYDKWRKRSGAGRRILFLPQDLFERLSREAHKQDLGLQPFTMLLLERALSEFSDRTLVERS